MHGAKGKLEPPKDLLDGYKKKRDFILSLQSHQKSTDQCAADLKAAFSPPVQSQAQQPRISQSPFNNQPKIQEHLAPLDNLMPLSEKYEHNQYLNIYSYFCKKQMKAVQAQALPNSVKSLAVLKP